MERVEKAHGKGAWQEGETIDEVICDLRKFLAYEELEQELFGQVANPEAKLTSCKMCNSTGYKQGILTAGLPVERLPSDQICKFCKGQGRTEMTQEESTAYVQAHTVEKSLSVKEISHSESTEKTHEGERDE